MLVIVCQKLSAYAYSRGYEDVGMAQKINSSKNRPKISPDDEGVALIT